MRGEWLTFLDSDDGSCRGARGAGRVATSTDAWPSSASAWVRWRPHWITDTYDRPDIRVPGRKSLRRTPGLLFYASGTGKLFHQSCREALWFEGRVLGDQPWTVRALLRAGDRIEVIGDVVYEWTRPRAGDASTSITAAKHGSARVAAEAAQVAVGALRQVADEAERTWRSRGPAGRRGRYVDRLGRSDWRDPWSGPPQPRRGAAGLRAVAAFLRAAPADSSGGPRRCLAAAVAPVAHWRRLSRDARDAACAMTRPDEAGRRAAPAAARGAVRVFAAACTDGRRGRPVVDAALSLVSLAAGAALALRARTRR